MVDILRGVLFRYTIRGGHASLAIIVTCDNNNSTSQHQDAITKTEEKMEMVLVIVRLGGSNWDNDTHANDMMALRSNIRRICKLGNEMEFHGKYDDETSANNDNYKAPPSDAATTDWHNWSRFMVDYIPDNSDDSNIRVCQTLKWSAAKCQITRKKYFVSSPVKQQQKKKNRISQQDEEDNVRVQQSSCSRHHGGGIGKRKQGEIVANFLLWVLSTIDNTDEVVSASEHEEDVAIDNDKLQSTNDEQQHLFMKRLVPLHPSLAAKSDLSKRKNTTNINHSNYSDIIKGGIIDAAGGAGHVSLALTLRGVHSTVVDPRKAVGMLPGRDRKALKKSKQDPFSVYRAWFGSRPKGVDTVFREGTSTNDTASTEEGVDVCDPLSLPICSMCSEDNLLQNCRAIVACHPDEATGSIVELAVENKIPFVVVPCCVFSRLFPERIKPVSECDGGANNIVSTYYELLDWLVAKHDSIKVTRLPFEGSNIAVWATFK